MSIVKKKREQKQLRYRWADAQKPDRVRQNIFFPPEHCVSGYKI